MAKEDIKPTSCGILKVRPTKRKEMRAIPQGLMTKGGPCGNFQTTVVYLLKITKQKMLMLSRMGLNA